ncbi:MAG: hypothetical protein ACI4J7_01090 [Ruminiclostridium sp.]
MARQLNIAGRNSNEIYTLFYPTNLINFCKYDFSLFLDHCSDLCRLAARTGEFSMEDMYSIRNSISNCHKYYEQNMRTIFDKIVIDCWIEHLCTQNSVSVGTLWQSFIHCRNDFEQAIFTRLSEYRHNRAINQWRNLLQMQEYARTKVDFVFGVSLGSPREGAARANYFDLMFNVAANEQGFPVEELASSGVYSAGRLPNSPFIMSSAAREILRNQLKDMNYPDSDYKSRKNPDLTDRTAMDAFAAVKSYIPNKNDSLAGTIIKSMTGTPERIYMPGSFKAVIDLEIDAITESGAVIQKCARCGEYYLKDEEYPYSYCSRPQRDGLTCLEAMRRTSEEVIPAKQTVSLPAPEEEDDDFSVIYVDKDVVNEKTEALYKEMAARVNVDMTQRDFSLWYQKELRLKEQIMLGEAGEKELNDFIERSRGDEFASKKQEPVFERQPRRQEQKTLSEDGREVKPFVFRKVERPAVQPKGTLAESEQEAMAAVQRLFGGAAPQPQSRQQMQPQPQMQPQGGYGTASPYGWQPAVQQPTAPQQTATVQRPVPGQQPTYQPYSQSDFSRPQPVSRVIRGASAAYPEPPREQQPYKPRTVTIPNGSRTAPTQQTASEDSDVKVFRPRREAGASGIENGGGYIEPSPYERLRQPLEDYKKAQEEPEPEVEGQLSAEEIVAPPPQKPLPANAISAYRSAGTASVQPEKADFSSVLSGIQREDGFEREEEILDSDGMPVTHKTKRVMNALFGPTKMSPFLRINLDDDDEQ